MARVSLEIACSEAGPPAGSQAFLAIQAWRRGDRAAAEKIYATVAADERRDPRCLVDLAAYALLSGRPRDANGFAELALSLSPRSTEALVNKSVSAFGLGDLPTALAAAERGLRQEPDHPQALMNCGLLLAVAGEYQRAATILTRVASERPRAWRVRVELARVLYATGDLAGSRRMLLQALPLAGGELPASLASPAKTTGFPVAGARAALLLAKDLLDAEGIPFFLVAGTLLGIVRGGDLLAHDKDVDIALDASIDPRKLASVFARHPDFDKLLTFPPEFAGTPPWGIAVRHTASRASIDIFGVVWEAGTLLQGLDTAAGKLASRVPLAGLAPIRWQGREWLAPDPVEGYLAAMYGDSWRTPDLHYDTILSNPSRVPESRPVAVALGLGRLGAALQASHWTRAYALCEQLLVHEEMAEVRDLANLLRARGAASNR